MIGHWLKNNEKISLEYSQIKMKGTVRLVGRYAVAWFGVVTSYSGGSVCE